MPFWTSTPLRMVTSILALKNASYLLTYVINGIQFIISKGLCKPSGLAFYVLLYKKLITKGCIDNTKPKTRGISDSTSGDSDQSFPSAWNRQFSWTGVSPVTYTIFRCIGHYFIYLRNVFRMFFVKSPTYLM